MKKYKDKESLNIVDWIYKYVTLNIYRYIKNCNFLQAVMIDKATSTVVYY